MSEEMVVRYCAPTLAGLKTASLFSCVVSSKRELIDDIRGLNKRLKSKGLRILPLSLSNGRALIYIYRHSRLTSDLSAQAASELLKEFGYSCDKPEFCILRLVERLRVGKEFPHEIGVFLGYPIEDVRGFIENRSENCKCTGCWKVYGDEKKALKTFAQYKKCSDIYYRQWLNGKSVEQLTVAG